MHHDSGRAKEGGAFPVESREADEPMEGGEQENHRQGVENDVEELVPDGFQGYLPEFGHLSRTADGAEDEETAENALINRLGTKEQEGHGHQQDGHHTTPFGRTKADNCRGQQGGGGAEKQNVPDTDPEKADTNVDAEYQLSEDVACEEEEG